MKSLNITVLLIGSDIPGGAERRIASFMRHINITPNLNMTLVINSELLNQLLKTETKPLYRIVALQSWCLDNSFNRMIRKSPGNIVYKILKRLFKITSNISMIFQFGLYLLLNRSDVLHLVLGSAMTTSLPFMLFTKKALVCSVVGSEVRDYQLLGALDQYILKWYLKNANIIDALSEELQQILIRNKMTDRSKIRVSESFIDPKGIQALAPKNTWVVFAARLVNEKNPLLFLDAIPKVLSTVSGEIHFFLLGTGELEPLIKKRISEYGIDKVVTTGFSNQVTAILEKSMIFCSLQEYENYPSRSLLEAMVCGNAIVATNVGYTYKLVDEYTGIRVSNTTDAVASAIIHLVKDTEKTQGMGRKARQLALEKYSPEAYCSKMREVYWQAYESHTK